MNNYDTLHIFVFIFMLNIQKVLIFTSMFSMECICIMNMYL